MSSSALKKTISYFALYTALAIPLLHSSENIHDTVSALQDKNRDLEERIRNIEEHSSIGNLELKTSDTVLIVGGKIRMDITYNDPSVGGSGGSNNDDFLFSPKSISENPDGERGETAFSAKESRLWFKTRKPTEYGPLLTLIELDFYGSAGTEKYSNSHNPRMRHAYFQLGKLTLGQTNSTFMGSGVPDTIKEPVDDIFARQPLVRWSEPFSNGVFHFSIEQPESTLMKGDGTAIAPDDDRVPDIAVKAVWFGSKEEISLSAVARNIRYDDYSADLNGSDEKTGAAMQFAGKIKTAANDNIRFGLSYGNVLGRYIAKSAFTTGAIDSDGKIELTPIYGAHLGYQHWWSGNIRSTMAYAVVEAENSTDIVTGSVIKKADSYHLNIKWSPIENSETGIEYTHGKKILQNGDEYELDRIHLIASYVF